MDKDYFVGLDVGSNSVGYAVTDVDYKLLRLKGKTAWGARIFDEATDASQRRAFRTSGRRAARRKYRIFLLNSLFAKELAAKDDTFLLRLSQSGYALEDKKDGSRFLYPLFKDKDLEKKFYKAYPTIWHLRAALLRNDPAALGDIRNVYLAIHHIIKYRGNFLRDGDIDVNKFDESAFLTINECAATLLSSLDEEGEGDYDNFSFIDKIDDGKVLSILKNKETNKIQKKKDLSALIHTNPTLKPYSDMFISLVVGGSVDLSKINPDSELKKVTFGSGFDDQADAVSQDLGEAYAFVEVAKAIYDYVYLFDLLGDKKSLSEAFVDVYEEHKKDLKSLKKIIIASDLALGLKGKERTYYKVFSNPEEKKNYAAFVHVGSKESRPSVHDFDSFVASVIAGIMPNLSESDKTIASSLLAKASRDELLLAVSNVSNSTIPHQLHETELRIILQNAGRVYPQIAKDSSKIISLFTFRVPYYFGPLDSRSPYSHVVRKENVTITPWNFSSAIDDEGTRRQFMESLTNNCTYLLGENVLPASSILYQDYINLDRLNGLRINGVRIEQSVKLDLFVHLVSCHSKTSIKGIERYLTNHYEVYKKDGVSLSGLNEGDEFVSSTRAALQSSFDLNGELKMVEDIVFIKAIYSDSPKDALDSIKKKYKLTQDQERAVNSLNCKGWGRYSRRLLEGLRGIDENGEVHLSVIDILHDRVMNFMEIKNDPMFGFAKLIDEANEAYVKDNRLTPKNLADQLIEDASPMNRRPTIQAVRMVGEIARITGRAPKAIAIEVTRTNELIKKTKDPRKRELERFLASCVKDSEEIYKKNAVSAKEELDKIEEVKLKGKHLYLYFKQMGLDVYTGKPIDVSEVLNGNTYDIDHIVPQSKIKDDSLDNTVLVSKVINQTIKRDRYPLPKEIRSNPDVVALWKFLLKKGGLSAAKYNALMRESPITDSELADFVSRQINVVNQSNKLIRDVLKAYYPDTRLIFSKAAYPSYIRKAYDIPKVRDLNDCHHAVDAYLNVVCGTVLDDAYSKDIWAIKWRKEHNHGEPLSYNMEHTLDRKMGEPGFLDLVKKTSERHDFLLTYRIAYQDSAFYKQTLNPADPKALLIPGHTGKDNPLSDVRKYGGFIEYKTEYMVPVTYGPKGKRLLGRVPTLYLKLYPKQEELESHLKTLLGLGNEKKVSFDFKNKVFSGQKIVVDGCSYILQSYGLKQICLKPVPMIFLPTKECSYVALIGKKAESLKEYPGDVFEFDTDRDKKNHYVISKNENLRIYKMVLDISKAKRFDYCPMITALRDETLPGVFAGLNMFGQIKLLLDTIKIYGRDSGTTSIKTNLFLKGTGVIMSDNVEVVDDSLTGLFSERKPL